MIEYRPLGYTSPQGKYFEFVYDGSISDSMAHDVSTFKFVGADGSYNQDKSIDSGEYAFTVYLSGSDRIKKLKELRNVLNEKGQENRFGLLDHPDPTLGRFDVVVLNYTVTHNVVSGTGFIQVDIVFSRTIRNLTDGGIQFNSKNILNLSRSIFDEISDFFSQIVDVVNNNPVTALINDVTNTVNNITKIMQSVSTGIDQVSIAFQDQSASILSNIDSLVQQPKILANTLQNLLTLPVLFSDDIAERVNAISDMIDSALTFSQDQLKEIGNASGVGKNILANRAVTLTASVSALMQVYATAESTTMEDLKRGRSKGFSNRSEIQAAINNIISKVELSTKEMTTLATSYSGIYFFNQYFDNTLQIKPLMRATILNLQNRLSLLPVGRSAVLPYNMHPVVLTAKIYDSVDIEVLEFFYNSNNIHGDEYYLLLRGRKIIWFGDNPFEDEIEEMTPVTIEPEQQIWQDNPKGLGFDEYDDNPIDGIIEIINNTPIGTI